MKLLFLIVVTVFVTQTSMSNGFKHNQTLESESQRNIDSVPITEDVRTVRKKPIYNNTLSIKKLKPKPVVNSHILRHRKRKRIHSAHHRIQKHRDAQTPTKVYRIHRNDQTNISISENNNNTSFKNPNTYINKLKSNGTCSCCNKSNSNGETKDFDVNKQTYTQSDQQDSMKPITHGLIRETTLGSAIEHFENYSPKITKGDFTSNPALTTSSPRLFGHVSYNSMSQIPNTVHPEKFGKSEEDHFVRPTPNHSTVKLATVLSVVAAMLLMPFLALWLSAVMAAARERVGNENFYDDQQLLLATHV